MQAQELLFFCERRVENPQNATQRYDAQTRTVSELLNDDVADGGISTNVEADRFEQTK